MLTARQSTRHAIAIYLSVAAIAHLLWETLQLPLDTIWFNSRMQDIAFAVVHCTVGDIMIAGFSLLAALVVLGARTWPAERFVPVDCFNALDRCRLHRLQRMAQHLRAQKLDLFGTDADRAMDRNGLVPVASMACRAGPWLCGGEAE